jgi:hypothetical protein
VLTVANNPKNKTLPGVRRRRQMEEAKESDTSEAAKQNSLDWTGCG